MQWDASYDWPEGQHTVARLAEFKQFLCRMLSYEPATGLALLLGGDQGIIVDVSLCVDCSSSWTHERLCLIMVIGHLETSQVVNIQKKHRFSQC